MSQETKQETKQATRQIATLKVGRGSARDAGQWQRYDVPFEPGLSVCHVVEVLTGGMLPTSYGRLHRYPCVSL